MLLGAAASGVYNSIFSVRIISSFAVLATSLLIYGTTKDDSSFLASVLYLTSFFTVRFGLRFYLDPFGGLFTIAAVYFMYKSNGGLAGVSAALAAVSREMASPLVVVFAFLSYHKKIGLKGFLLGVIAVALPALFWIYFATGIQSAIVGNATGLQQVSLYAVGQIPSILKGWFQYALISPLVVIGLLFSPRKRERPEFYPALFSIPILSMAPGFIVNGAASEYPYIFNTLGCLIAGSGLIALGGKLKVKRDCVVKLAIGIVVLEFAGQSYAATVLSPNGVIGIQDYGYWYDQKLLSYLNSNYHGGKIYAENLDGLLDPRLASNWVWMPQTITPALRDNPSWVVTFSSYVKLASVPTGVTVVTIGPFLVVHQTNTSLASFMQPTNRSAWSF